MCSSDLSVYLPVARNNLPRALDAFDFADPSMVVGTREVSNTASQALFMLNNPFVLELSDAFARKVLRSTKDNQGRIEQSFQMAFGRAPTKEELQVSLRYIKKAKESQVNAKPDEALFQALSQFCQALFGAAEFRILN